MLKARAAPLHASALQAGAPGPPGHPHRRGHHSFCGLVAPARRLLTLASPRHHGLPVTWAEWVLSQSAWTGPCLTFCIWVSPLGAQLVKSAPAVRDTPGFDPWVGKIPWRRGMATHSSILAWRIPMDRGAWWATIHGVAESGTTERLHVLSEGFFGDVYPRENTAGLHSSTSGSGERGTWWLFPRWSLSVLCTLQEEAFVCVRRRPGWLLAHNHQGCVATSRRCEKCGGRDGSPLPPLSRPLDVVVPQLPNHFSSSTAVPRYP